MPGARGPTHRRVLVALCIVLLLLGPASAWTQLAGNEERTSLLAGFPQYDVVGQFRGDGPIDLTLGPGAVDLGDGIWTLTKDCALHHRDYAGLKVATTDVACGDLSPRLMGYDPLFEQFIACHDGMTTSTAVVIAFNKNGAQRWTLEASELSQGLNASPWQCGGVLIDQSAQTLVVPAFQAAGDAASEDHRVFGLDLNTGAIAWQTKLPVNATISSFNPTPLDLGDVPVEEDALNVRPAVVVAADDAYFVTGTALETGIAWSIIAEQTGGLQSVQLLPDENQEISPEGPAVGVSAWAGSRRAEAILGLGPDLVRLNAVTGTRETIRLADPFMPSPTRGALWYGDVAIVPGVNRLVALEAQTPLELRWDLPVPGLQDLAMQAPNRLFALTSNPPQLLEISVLTRDVVHALPLPFAAAKMIPTQEGVWLMADNGDTVMLGNSPLPGPRVTPEHRYPGVGEPLSVEVAFDGDYVLHWGDGTTVKGRGSETHTASYDDGNGDYVLRVTGLVDENTTTKSVIIHVGETPAQKLTTIQKWFAPENQEQTFGIIGAILTTIGTVFAFAVRRSRRYRLGKDLQFLQRLRIQAQEDPLKSLGELRKFRLRSREKVQKGKIDDAYYGAVSSEAAAVSQTLQQRILRIYTGRLSKNTRDLLDAAVSDGVLTQDELGEIADGLNGDQLKPDERKELLAMLADWQSN